MELLNALDIHFLLSIVVMLTIFVSFYLSASKRQKHVMKKMEISLKHQEQAIQQANLMLAELKRTNRLLAELAGPEFNSNEPATSMRGSSNSNNANNMGGEGVDTSNQYKLYVGNIDYAATEDELAHHFAHTGLVEFVNIPVNRYTGRARGFGFVTFSSRDDAERAMTLNGSEFRGRQIQVNFAKERDTA